MEFSANLTTRDGISVLLPSSLAISPVRWSWSTFGGSRDATIELAGPQPLLWDAIHYLGHIVTINNAQADEVWTGEVTMVSVANGATLTTVDLSTVKNRVAVVHTVDNGTELERVITDWAEDATSIERYGRREHLESMSNVSTAEAEARRDTILSEASKPVARISRSAGQPKATLYCLGVLSDLDRVYYQDLRGREVFDPAATGELPLGWRIQSDLIGFYASTSRICHLGAALDPIASGMKISVSGSNANDGIYSVVSGPTVEEQVSFTDDTIRFEASDDIYSDNNAFGNLLEEEMVRLQGVSVNDEFWFVKSVDPGYITVDPNSTVDEDLTATTITVTQGNSVVVSESITTERPEPGAKTVTIEAVGTKVAQSFEVTSAEVWTFSELRLRMRKVGTPGDTITCQLYEGSTLTSATLLESFSISGSLIAEESDWVAVPASSTHELDPAKTYWFTVERTGSPDAENYFVISVDTEVSYEAGQAMLWDGATWSTAEFSVPFQVWGKVSLGELLEDMLLAGIQNIGGVDIASDLSALRTQYRDGETTARAEVEKLVQSGGTNNQQLILDAKPERRITVSEWPERYEVELAIDDEGRLIHVTGAALSDGRSPVGRWARVEGVPEVLNDIVEISPAPIEEAEFDAASGQMTFLSRNQKSVWELQAVEQG